MSDENDFISLWKKKSTNESKSSVIGDTINQITIVEQRCKVLEAENVDLKANIRENIEIMSKTEGIIKKIMAEKQQLADSSRQVVAEIESKLTESKKENSELNTKILLLVDDNNKKDNEISKLSTELSEIQFKSELPSTDADVNQQLVEKLQSELSKKKTIIANFESKYQVIEDKISSLMEENLALKGQLSDINSAPPPIPEPIETTPKPMPPPSDTQTLDRLVQDLQSDLNKYKRLVKELKEENKGLKSSASGGVPVESGDLKALKKENENLKKDIAKLEKSSKKKSKDDSQPEIEKLNEQLAEKDRQIKELQSSKPSASSGPAPSGLVEDLQKKLNKMKAVVKKLKDENAELKKK